MGLYNNMCYLRVASPAYLVMQKYGIKNIKYEVLYARSPHEVIEFFQFTYSFHPLTEVNTRR
jgi:hypothetical protein